MSRQATLLAVIAAVALTVAAFFFLIKPKMDEVAALEAEAEDIRAQQTQVQAEIDELQRVRAESPNLESELAAIGSIVPDTPALPSALRQLQLAGDESGVTLVSIAPARPTSAGVEGLPRLATIPVALTLEGGYFQVVDFLRRVEDPAITARGVLVTGVSVTADEYPTLAVTVSAQMFATLDQPPAAEEPEPEPEATEGQTETDGETDVEVDVDVTEEDAA
jgi:Tfp pilus assembly protein PilO